MPNFISFKIVFITVDFSRCFYHSEKYIPIFLKRKTYLNIKLGFPISYKSQEKETVHVKFCVKNPLQRTYAYYRIEISSLQ